MTTENSTPDTGEEQNAELDNASRRKFFKRAAVGGSAALAAGLGSYAAGRASIDGAIDEGWPENILADDYKPFDQRNTMWCYAFSPLLAKKWPERNEQFGRLVKEDPKHNWAVRVPFFETKPHDNSRPGFTQLDKALTHSSWYPPSSGALRLSALGMPDTEFYRWDQSDVVSEQYQFASKKDAADAIRSAARLYGAVRCGIAKRDKRWDYDPIYKLSLTPEQLKGLNESIHPMIKGKSEAEYNEIVPMIQEEMLAGMDDMIKMLDLKEETLSWEKAFPFEPKTVIVLAVPMDYDNVACAPSLTSGATVGDGYTKMATLAAAIAKFIRELGYHAVAAGNDLGSSVAYGIAAGMGECGRNNQLLVPGYGPRVRLCKVYTDFDFVEYDQARSWGITEFCKSCKKCGEACPSEAIDMADDTHYYFEGEHSDQPGYNWSNHEGVKKFHTDAKKCLTYWFDSDTDCTNCAAACTFNEPDFWHHWFIMAINPFMPKAIHGAMAELHPAFGYGGQTGTPKAHKIKKFWKSGEGLRINPTNRHVFGAVGKA
jgi:reductive dehalogenase